MRTAAKHGDVTLLDSEQLTSVTGGIWVKFGTAQDLHNNLEPGKKPAIYKGVPISAPWFYARD